MIKLLLFVAVVFAVIWFLRGGRPAGQRGAAQARPAKPPAPQDMVEFPVCHVHLPRADALAGPGGQVYCCTEHSRQAAG